MAEFLLSGKQSEANERWAFRTGTLNVIRVTLTQDGRKQFLAVDPDGERIDQFEV